MNYRRFLPIFLIAFAGMMLVQFYVTNSKKKNAPEKEPPPPATQVSEDTAASRPVTAGAKATSEKIASSQWQVHPGKEATYTIGSLDPKDGYKLLLELRSKGAAIGTVKLSDYFQTVADKQLYEEDPAQYARKAAADPDKYKGHYPVVNPVDFRGAQYFTLSTRQVKLYLGEKDADQPPDVVFDEFRTKHWTRVKTTRTDDHQSVTYELTLYRRPIDPKTAPSAKPPKALTVRKTYTVTKGSYSIGVELSFINHMRQKVRLDVDQAGPTGITREDVRSDQRMAVLGKLVDNKIKPVMRGKSDLDKWPYGQEEIVGRSDAVEKPLVWIGYVNKFFGAIMYLMPREKDRLNAASYDARYYLTAIQDSKEFRTWRMGMRLEGLELGAAGGEGKTTRSCKLDLFVGPKQRKLLKENPLYSRLEYVETVTMVGKWCAWCTFSWLMVGLMWLLHFFSSFLFGNFGLAIILLVLIVRVLLHPLTKKSQISMAKMSKAMAALKPQMDKIKEKYANDKAAQQRETMKLYKEHGNPMANMLGCLPMLLQMPIWIALYSGLNSEVALRHAAFLPFWITDLAAPDQLFSWKEPLWLIGNSFNLLPILVAVGMFLQTKFNPAMASQSASPDQAQQQKMMKYMMPLMMLFIFFKAPSGLNLYIMASTMGGVLEQYFIRRHIREQEELQAASETFVKVSGKGPRGARPKKNKGSFWVKRG